METLNETEKKVLDEMMKTIIIHETPFSTINDAKAQLDYHRVHGPLASTQLAINNFDYLVKQYSLGSKQSRYLREYLSEARKKIITEDFN